MHRKTLLTLLALAGTLSVGAQSLSNGFYRVQNYGSKRYAYVYDRTGSVNLSTTTADMGAVVLYSEAEKRLSDPASVIYISSKGKNGQWDLYDLETQGTGVHRLLNYYVSATTIGAVAGNYLVFEPTYNMYLWDAVPDPAVTKSYMVTKAGSNANFRNWTVIPVNASSNEYLGITPEARLNVNGKYYHPYHIGFAMAFASSGMKAYYVSDIKDDAVIIKEVVGTVPAATPVIVECSTTAAASNRVNLYANSPATITGNQLSGNYFCYNGHGETAYQVYDASTMRLLAVKNGHLAFVADTEKQYTTRLSFKSGKTTTYKDCIPANSSYLRVPAGTAAELPVMTQAEYDALHPTTKKGDVNGDGQVNSTDALVLGRIIAAGKTAAQQPEADINNDGIINSTDVLVLGRIIAAGK